MSLFAFVGTMVVTEKEESIGIPYIPGSIKTKRELEARAHVAISGIDTSGKVPPKHLFDKTVRVSSGKKLDKKIRRWVENVIVPANLEPEWFVELEVPVVKNQIVYFLKLDRVNSHTVRYGIWYFIS